MNKPVEVTAVFLGGPRGMGHLAMSLPEGSEIRWSNVPIAPHKPGDSAQSSEGLLELVQERPAGFIGLRGSAGWPVNRKYVQPLGTRPGDDGMSTPVHSGTPMDLQRFTDENRGTAASALVACGQGWIPKAVPTRLASQELKTLEARAKVVVLLDQEDHAGLVQGMKQSGTTAPDVEGGD